MYLCATSCSTIPRLPTWQHLAALCISAPYCRHCASLESWCWTGWRPFRQPRREGSCPFAAAGHRAGATHPGPGPAHGPEPLARHSPPLSLCNGEGGFAPWELWPVAQCRCQTCTRRSPSGTRIEWTRRSWTGGATSTRCGGQEEAAG